MSNVEFVLCHVMGFSLILIFTWYWTIPHVLFYAIWIVYVLPFHVLDLIHLSISCVGLEFIAIDLSCWHVLLCHISCWRFLTSLYLFPVSKFCLFLDWFCYWFSWIKSQLMNKVHVVVSKFGFQLAPFAPSHYVTYQILLVGECLIR